LNYVRGQTVPNAVVAPVDANGEVCFYADADTHLVVDVNGWFAAGFSGMTPVRWVDTRVGAGAPVGKVTRSAPVRVSVLGRDGVPSTGVSAVSLNVTVTEPSAAGFVTVYPCAGGRPWSSNLNYVRGQTVPNAVVAPVDANGEVCFYADADTHLVVDVNGWFAASDTGGFAGMTPVRWADTRIGLGWSVS
jgi:hypothetical protein